MAPSKLAIVSIFLALIFSQIRADIPARQPVRRPEVSPSDGPYQKINPRCNENGWHSQGESIQTGVSSYMSRKTTEHEKNTPTKNGVSPGKACLHGNSGM
ncbi:hypothetical protein C1H46_027681 [Malus baccata]|uniref:Uncharacterized protein n=1 Tax=Malus baccata TaxID=106549 RepID=A0A540LK11_MALBA|nr:hypothetical protein C1H46_027681 [Malus baccata]